MTSDTQELTKYERWAEVYEATFRVGLVVGILLGCLALVGPTLAALMALSVWTMVLVLVMPPLIAKLHDSGLTFPDWFIRGPH